MNEIFREYTFADGHRIGIGKRTLIMGILNFTPDSFFDGGKWNTLDKALRHIEEMAAEGADIVDIGAESTRPGAVPLNPAEECERLAPLLERLIPRTPLPISLDTYNPVTAARFARNGIHMINDVWGLQGAAVAPTMAEIVAGSGLPVVVMHNGRGAVCTGDVIENIVNFFRRSLNIAAKTGIPAENIILDPGIGFGTNTPIDLTILRRLAELKEVDGRPYPLLVGASRKRFIGETLGLDTTERLEGTLAASMWSVMAGANILRVHDVQAHVRLCRMWEAIRDS